MVCYPFDSIITGYDEDNNPIYDRAANSQVMANWMKRYFSNGIFGQQSTGDYGFAVTTASNGLHLNVSAGACNIEGRFASDDSVTDIELDTADTTYDRIDAIVLRLSLETETRAIYVGVIKGTPASNPQAPELTRNSSVYDLKIAEVRVAKGAATISQANIKDTRLNTTVCGLVAVPLQVFDTTTLYAQLEAALLELEATNQTQFIAWFEQLQEILDENVAGHLQNEIYSIRNYNIDFSIAAFTFNATNEKYEYTFVDSDIGIGGAHITANTSPKLIFFNNSEENMVSPYKAECFSGYCTISSDAQIAGTITGRLELKAMNVEFDGGSEGSGTVVDTASIAETLDYLGIV